MHSRVRPRAIIRIKPPNHLFKARDMSEEVLREKVQRLVTRFREQLRGVLEVNLSLLHFSQPVAVDYDAFCGFVCFFSPQECSSSARKAPLIHRPRYVWPPKCYSSLIIYNLHTA